MFLQALGKLPSQSTQETEVVSEAKANIKPRRGFRRVVEARETAWHLVANGPTSEPLQPMGAVARHQDTVLLIKYEPLYLMVLQY